MNEATGRPGWAVWRGHGWCRLLFALTFLLISGLVIPLPAPLVVVKCSLLWPLRMSVVLSPHFYKELIFSFMVSLVSPGGLFLAHSFILSLTNKGAYYVLGTVLGASMNEKTKAPAPMAPSFPWDHNSGPPGHLGGAPLLHLARCRTR